MQRSGEAGSVRLAALGGGKRSATARLVVLVGPAGAGKTTLAHRLIDAAPARRAFSVSHTTRAMRRGEQDGVDYHFVERAAFEARIAAGGFVEYAEVHGNLYGTSYAAIESHLAAGRDVLFDVDIVGATALYEAFPDRTRLIFITPPDWTALCARLEARGSETPETLRRRLRTARAELDAVLTQLEAGMPWDLLCNDVVDLAVADLEATLARPRGQFHAADLARVQRMAGDAAADSRADPLADPHP